MADDVLCAVCEHPTNWWRAVEVGLCGRCDCTNGHGPTIPQDDTTKGDNDMKAIKHLAWMVRHPIYAAKWHLRLGVRRSA